MLALITIVFASLCGYCFGRFKKPRKPDDVIINMIAISKPDTLTHVDTHHRIDPAHFVNKEETAPQDDPSPPRDNKADG